MLNAAEVLTLAHLLNGVLDARVLLFSKVSIVLDRIVDAHSEVHRPEVEELRLNV
jgi:hypothetical protein